MSKQRPSRSGRRPRRGGIDTAPAKTQMRYWQGRVFRNTFTRDGRLIPVRGWSVKIQHQGRRRTFSLGATSRPDAMLNAHRLYQAIVTQGWDALARMDVARHPIARHAPVGADPDAMAKGQARYWKPRLIRRKYTEGLTPVAGRELSVRITHKGTSYYFPLGTEDQEQAAVRASQLYRSVLAEGWEQTRARVPREITVAVFWATNPLACTYTTLFTDPAESARAAPGRPAGSRDGPALGIVEPDDGVRRAMARWLTGQRELRSPVGVGTGAEALRLCRADVRLVLVNRDLPDRPGGECVEALRARRPDLPVLSYGVYEDSDRLFLSFTGVSAGYLLRRRPPAELLEPIGRSVVRPTLTARLAAQRIETYFRSLFDLSRLEDDVPGTVPLTYREQEILECLSRGYVDKEIAQQLGISAWTVHGHLRNIFEKLRVHTRTEAAVKYLQK